MPPRENTTSLVTVRAEGCPAAWRDGQRPAGRALSSTWGQDGECLSQAKLSPPLPVTGSKPLSSSSWGTQRLPPHSHHASTTEKAPNDKGKAFPT